MQTLMNLLKGDRQIWGVVLFLVLISILAVYSSSKLVVMRFDISAEMFALRHAFFLLIGLVCMFFIHRMDYNYFSKGAQWLMIGCLPVLLITLLVGREGRWIDFPGFSIQPSEIAKFALIMYLARIITKKQDKIGSLKEGFMPILLPVLLVCALIFPADLSTAALIFLTSLLMMFIGRTPFTYILSLVTASLVSAFFFVFILLNAPDELLILRADTWKSRIVAFQQARASNEMGFQPEQAHIAIANGRVPQGPGKSVQKNLLPEAYSDYIYAIIVEEAGLLGALFILFLYLYLFYRSIAIFRRSPGTFGALLAVSLAISLVAQALLNILVTVGLLPVTGVTLPFISRGGTSILVSSLAIGVILSVDAHSGKKRRKSPKKTKPKGPPSGKTVAKKPAKQPKIEHKTITLGDL